MSEPDFLDLRIERTGREYLRVPRQVILQWIAERRVTGQDLVRPVGSSRWMKVSLAPELAPSPALAPGGPLPSATSTVARAGATAVAPSRWTTDLGIEAPAKSGRRRRKRLLEDTALDMTPMIDVTFQLLIFFMFTNQLANPNPITVPLAEYGRGVTPDGMQSILIDEQGRYYLGESAREENIAASLEALVSEVKRNAEQVDQPLDVIISAHKDSRHVQTRELIDRLQDVPNLGAVRFGVEEQP